MIDFIEAKPASGSTDYKAVLITATTSGGANTIHTAIAGTYWTDWCNLWVCNTHTSAVTCNIGWGGVTDARMLVKAVSIPPNTLRPLPLTWIALPLRNAGVISAWAGTASKLTIMAEVFTAAPGPDDLQDVLLSGGNNGLGIPVTQTAIATGDTIHTVDNTTTNDTKIVLFASNIDTVARTLTLGWGGVTDPDNLVMSAASLPGSSMLIPIVLGADGLPLQNNLIVKAAASAANVINIFGAGLRRGKNA